MGQRAGCAHRALVRARPAGPGHLLCAGPRDLYNYAHFVDEKTEAREVGQSPKAMKPDVEELGLEVSSVFWGAPGERPALTDTGMGLEESRAHPGPHCGVWVGSSP